MNKKLLYIVLILFTFIGVVNAEKCTVVTGSGKNIGDEIACGTEHFYVISNDGENVKMLAKYNLLVGNIYEKIDFQDKYYNKNDIYLNKEVQNLKNEGYSVYRYYSENDENSKTYYTGVTMYRYYQKSDVSTVFLEEPVSSLSEFLNNSKVQEKLKSGYYNDEVYQLSDGTYIGGRFYKSENYTYKTILLKNRVSTEKELIMSNEFATESKDYYYFENIKDSSGKFIGAVVYQRENYDYKTIVLDETKLSLQELYHKEEINNYIKEGYTITRTLNSSETCETSGEKCTYDYYYVNMIKNDDKNYITIISDEEYSNSSDLLKNLKNNTNYNELIENGYYISEYLYDRYYSTTYTTNYGYSYKTYSYKYFGVKLNKSTVYEEEKIKVYQDETAIGAHGDEAGKPAPTEIGVVTFYTSTIYGKDIYNGADYNEAYHNYEFKSYDDSGNEIAGNLDILTSYEETLMDSGFNVKKISLITIDEINEIVRYATNEELPLDTWAEESWESISTNSLVTNYTYKVGSLKENIPEEYNWLWSTTYWTQTMYVTEPYSFGLDGYIYFVDTLGNICADYNCPSSVGAGLRPVITLSASDLIYTITTKTDGNGSITPSAETEHSGNEVTFVVTPNEGFELKEVKVTDSNGNTITFTDYKFTMPDANVLIEAIFVAKNPETTAINIIVSIILVIISVGIIIRFKKKANWLNT